jgi:hypothetical protein
VPGNVYRLAALFGAIFALAGFFGDWASIKAFGNSVSYTGLEAMERGALVPYLALTGGFIGLVSAAFLLFMPKPYLKYLLILAGCLVLIGGSMAVASIELEVAFGTQGLGIFVSWGYGSIVLPIGGLLLIAAGLGVEKITMY